MVGAADHQLTVLIEQLMVRMSNGEHPLVDHKVLDFIESNVDICYQLIRSLLSPAVDSYSQDLWEQAHLVILSEALTFIKYAIEQKRLWASEFLQQWQLFLAKTVFQDGVNSRLLQCLIDILHQSEIPIIDAIRDANAKLMSLHHINNVTMPAFELETISDLLEEVASLGSGCPYEMYENLVSQTHQVVPEEIQIIMVHEMAQAELALIHETAVLMLLHPNNVVRSYVASILAMEAARISPTSLRRMIVMRNWLPVAERVELDELIKAARKAGVACQPWPSATIIKIIATGFDGLGAQSILLLSKEGSRYYLSGVLLKEDIGIREPLLISSDNQDDLENIIKEMVAGVIAIVLADSYLDIVLPHFIALNVQRLVPPSPLLIGVCEAVGISHWRSELLNEQKMLAKLLADLDQLHQEQGHVISILNKSRSWVSQQHIGESWYEYDAEVDAILKDIIGEQSLAQSGQKFDQLVGQTCQQILEPRRRKWFRRLLWMAIWAKNATIATKPAWQEYTIIANILATKKPLAQIPLMQAISAETLCAGNKSLKQPMANVRYLTP